MGSPRATFAVLMAGSASFALLQSLVTPVLPTIQTEFHTSQNTVTWVMTANLLSAAIFTPLVGRVGDAAGKHRALVAVLLALAAGSALAAVAPTIGVLIAARAVQGAAGAVFPLSYGIIRDEFPPDRVASGVGAVSAVIAAGGGLGLVLAGPIVDVLGYAWLFWLPAISGGGTAVAAFLVVPASPARRASRFSWTAALLLSSGLVALLLAIGKGPERGWGSGTVLALFAAAAVLLGWWIFVDVVSARPFIDMRMMRSPVVWTTNLVALLFGAGQFAVFAFLPQFVQTSPDAGYGFGSTVTQAGLLLLPMLAAMFVSGLVSGRVEPVFRSRAQLVAGAGLSVPAFVLLALAHDARWEIAVAGAVFGTGLGLALSSMANLIVTGVPAEQTSAASAMNANVRTVGGAIGAAVAGSVVTAAPGPSGTARESGYEYAFLLLAGVSVAAVAAALAVPRRRGAGCSSLGVSATELVPDRKG
ncbi:MFS transporter [Actinomadura decatromicini]|uniref:MFS transporter n=1 Tax=Actinomadura decatromicini TaxID=2604572 RepID=A0A5D3FRJ7_9ACTN|nr:MFS transporter [Actinomadura decatromicini]TYK50556.1 MFS transporter [Actinomadura decatromicini]